jgi:hypothetical protein
LTDLNEQIPKTKTKCQTADAVERTVADWSYRRSRAGAGIIVLSARQAGQVVHRLLRRGKLHGATGEGRRPHSAAHGQLARSPVLRIVETPQKKQTILVTDVALVTVKNEAKRKQEND